jgi:hypothetical protein
MKMKSKRTILALTLAAAPTSHFVCGRSTNLPRSLLGTPTNKARPLGPHDYLNEEYYDDEVRHSVKKTRGQPLSAEERRPREASSRLSGSSHQYRNAWAGHQPATPPIEYSREPTNKAQLQWMSTQQMKSDLLSLGYTPEEVEAISPDIAKVLELQPLLAKPHLTCSRS